MDRRIIRENEVDTKEELCKLFQTLSDNQYQLEAKIEQLGKTFESLTKKTKKTKKNEGSVIVKTLMSLIIGVVLAMTCFGAVNVREINYSTVTSGTFDQDLRKWIGILNTDIVNAGGTILTNRGTGNVFFVDSVTGADTRVGTSLSTAVATIDAAVNLCTANNGDVIYVVQGHATTIDNGTSDAIDLDVAGITVVGLGFGNDAPELLYDTVTDELVIDADNVVIFNIRFLAGVSAVLNAIDVKDGADNCAIIRCNFPEPTTSSWEFVRGIVVTTADDLIIANCEQRTVDAIGATNFIDNDNGITTGLKVVGNIAIGQYSEGILHSDDIDLENWIVGNDFSNTSSGEHAIEFTAAATGTMKNNTLAGDTYGAILDSGSLRLYGNLQTVEINQGAIDVPLIAGKIYVLSASAASVASSLVDLFDVTGGPIEIISCFGACTVDMSGSPGALNLEIDATTAAFDADFTTAVNIDALNEGDIIQFAAVTAGEAVLVPTAGVNAGLPISWYCPVGMIEQATASTGTGSVVWRIAFRPLVSGVTVVPQ